MRKAERAEYILNRLDELYPNPPIPLLHSSPFTLLIAVLLSAQCTDQRVNLVTPQLFKLANNPAKMSRLPLPTIRSKIKSCGLAPQKARAIKQLSLDLVHDHDGNVPNTFEELEKLPGVGHKTASVVMAQVFGVPTFPVDTHIHRLAQRWGLTDGKNVKQSEHDLKKLFPVESWNHLHLQIIYYGREHCTARGCDGTVCEICSICYPNRRKPKLTKKA